MSQTAAQPGGYPVVSQITTYPANHSPCGRVNEKLLARPILGLGATQLIIGVLCIIFNIAAIFLGYGTFFIGHGIWSGIFFILAGAFGIAAGKSKRTGFVIACMVMSIISSVSAVPLIFLASIGWGISYEQSEIAMNALLVFLGLLECVVAIVNACLCCHGVCCCSQAGRVHGPSQAYAVNEMQTIVIQGTPMMQQTSVGFLSNPQGHGQQIQPGAIAPPTAYQVPDPQQYETLDYSQEAPAYTGGKA